jgi:hypothetical protein
MDYFSIFNFKFNTYLSIFKCLLFYTAMLFLLVIIFMIILLIIVNNNNSNNNNNMKIIILIIKRDFIQQPYPGLAMSRSIGDTVAAVIFNSSLQKFFFDISHVYT